MVEVKHLTLQNDQNFFFATALKADLTLYCHLVNYTTCNIFIRNTTHQSLQVPNNHRLVAITEIRYKDLFQTDLGPTSAALTPKRLSLHEARTGVKVSVFGLSLETTLDNGVKIYGEPNTVEQLYKLVKSFPSIWGSSRFVKIPEEK